MPDNGNKIPLWNKRHPYPTADGSFIQSWLVDSWSIDRWQDELNILKEADMNYLILAPTVIDERGKKSQAIYPSDLPGISLMKGHEKTLDNCLKAAESLGLKVFIGLNDDRHWWQLSEADKEWFVAEMHKGNAIAKELYELYKARYPETFYGWYWVWEISNLHIKLPKYQIMLAQALNIQLDFLSNLDNSMPLMLCPFMIEKEGTPLSAYEAWSNFFSHAHFRKGDIFCPQDAVGAGWLRMDTFVDWFEAMKKACDQVEGLRFWSDVETFRQKDWTSSTLDRFVEQLKLPSHLVDNYVTFAYSHYFSPYIVPKGYHQVYLHYLQTGKLPTNKVKPPTGLSIKKCHNKVTLSWQKQDIQDICGYLIYANNKFISRLQPKPDPTLKFTLDNSFSHDNSLEETTTYQIIAYDYAGNMSEPVYMKI